MAVTSRKVVIVMRPTRLDQLVARFNTIQQAKFYVEHLQGDFADYEREHTRYYEALEKTVEGADKVARVHRINWLQLPNFLFGPDDIVATVGQDGLIVNALKYLGSQLIIGFNSDAARWDGVLAQFSPEEAASILRRCLDGKINTRRITRGVVELSDKQKLYAVNDFFVGVSNHSSARYRLIFGDREETHSSSGVIVSTPLGRSAWMRSILTGASNIVNGISKQRISITEKGKKAWDGDTLFFAVREPFPSVSSKTDLVFGKIDRKTGFTIESKMGENGIIFSDGIQADFLHFNYSVRATFGIAPEKGILVMRESGKT